MQRILEPLKDPLTIKWTITGLLSGFTCIKDDQIFNIDYSPNNFTFKIWFPNPIWAEQAAIEIALEDPEYKCITVIWKRL